MEIKKSPKADLEGHKTTWLLAGYVLVMAVLFLGFEWTQRDVKIDTSNQVVETVFEEEIEIPITEQPEQVQAPPPEAPSIAETLTIVDDDSDIQESTIQSSEETGQGVEIKYTGLRDGEKLYEEVLGDKEVTKPSFHPKIRIAQVREYDYFEVKDSIDELISISHEYDDLKTVAAMKRIVPEYISNHSAFSVLDK